MVYGGLQHSSSSWISVCTKQRLLPNQPPRRPWMLSLFHMCHHNSAGGFKVHPTRLREEATLESLFLVCQDLLMYLFPLLILPCVFSYSKSSRKSNCPQASHCPSESSSLSILVGSVIKCDSYGSSTHEQEMYQVPSAPPCFSFPSFFFIISL